MTTLTIDLNDPKSRAIGRQILGLFGNSGENWPSESAGAPKRQAESKPARPAERPEKPAEPVDETPPWADGPEDDKPAETRSERPASPVVDPDDDPWS